MRKRVIVGLDQENYTAQVLMAEFEDQASRPHDSIESFAAALNNAVALHDSITALHAQRVSEVCFLVASELDLGFDIREAAQITGMVHDVGKLRVPKSVLNKSEPLTSEERAQLEVHAEAGEQMIAFLGEQFEEIARGVRSHHERWDGSGYPDGLVGGNIPVMARLLAVVDVYDAMTSTRAYRPSVYSSGAAQEYLADSRARLFDPVCVDAALAVLDGWEKGRRSFSLPDSF